MSNNNDDPNQAILFDDDTSSSSEEEDEEHAPKFRGVSRPPEPVVEAPDPDEELMKLTEIEKSWALEVKRAVEDDEELLPITDYEYAQHALVAEGDLQEALYRIQKMQDFRQHYDIHHSVEQGLECLVGMMEQQPGFMLHMDIDPVSHASVNVIDLGGFDPDAALALKGTHENWKHFIAGVYYMKFTSQPCLANVRAGFFALADFGGIFNQNFKPEAQQRLFEELLGCYPFKWQTFMAFNTGYLANVFISIIKPLFPRNLKQNVQLGCQLEEWAQQDTSKTESLADFYFQPTREEAQKHMLIKAYKMLVKRMKNHDNFRL